MERSDIEILVKHEKHWITLDTAGYVKNLDNASLEELLGVYKRNVSTRPVNKYCQVCVANMLKDIYRGYQELKKLIEAASEVVEVVTEIVKKIKKRKSRAKKPAVDPAKQ